LTETKLFSFSFLLFQIDCYEYLHTSGWIHKDLKGSNLLFSRQAPGQGPSDGKIFLVDYGLVSKLTRFEFTVDIRQFMDKLNLTGRNLGRVFNSRLGHACICHAIACITRRPNLKLKTRPKQFLGSLPLAFALPGQLWWKICLAYSSDTLFQLHIIDKSYRQVLTPINNSQHLLKLEILDKLRLVTFHNRQHTGKWNVRTGSNQFKRNTSSHHLDSLNAKDTWRLSAHSFYNDTVLWHFIVTMWINFSITLHIRKIG